jgi:prophage antirepressor-like protein/phage anti-repressor protein
MMRAIAFPAHERRVATRLEFDGTVFDVLDRNGRPWLSTGQIAEALQLGDGETALLDVHQRHWYEFTETMLARLPMETPEGPKAVPAFSPLGAYVAATLVATPIAARFRRWLLEHIDGFWTGLAETAERLNTRTREQAAELARLQGRIEVLEGERDRQAEALRRLDASLERLSRVGQDPANAGGELASDGLIPVWAGEIGGKPCPVVDARDLHRALGVNAYVTSWVRSRIAEYGFVEGEDYAVSYRRGREHPQGGRAAADYRLSLEMAEALARFERSEKGRAARQWLAECREKLAERALAERLGSAPASEPAPGSLGQTLAFVFGDRQVRGTWIGGEPWWVAADVLQGLDYAENSKPSRVMAHVPEPWKGVNRIHTPGGEQEMLLISEQGLYFFLGRSDKPKALPFQMYYAGEVLPAIRKTGRYDEGQRPASPSAPEIQDNAGTVRPLAQGSAPELAGSGLGDHSLLFNFVGHPVRVEIRRGTALFIAKDVAEALGYRWSGFTGTFARIPGSERKRCRVDVDTPTGLREIAAITEAGLRILLRNSGQPKELREGFLQWLEETVLPDLRSGAGVAGPSTGSPEARP